MSHEALALGRSAIEGLIEVLELDTQVDTVDRRDFEWQSGALRQRVAYAPTGAPEEASCLVSATTTLPFDAGSAKPLELLSALNRQALLGRWALDRATQRLQLSTGVCLAGSPRSWRELWWTLAAALQAGQVEAQVAGIAEILGTQYESVPPTKPGAGQTSPAMAVLGEFARIGREEACPIDAQTYRDAAFAESGPWIFPVPEDGNVSAIVPLDPEMRAGDFLESQAGGDQAGAAVIRLDGQQSHPQLGSGLLAVLRMPTGFVGSAQDANRLNLVEGSSPPDPLQLGAWSFDEGLSYSLFVPTLLWLEDRSEGRIDRIVALLNTLASRVPWSISRIQP